MIWQTYDRFGATAVNVKCQVLEFLIEARREGKLVAGYGAPAKGNTLLNYCGVGPELLAFTVDRSPHKQGRFLPGSRDSDLRSRADLRRTARLRVHPAGNLKDEIIDQMRGVRDWGGKFVVPIPSLQLSGCGSTNSRSPAPLSFRRSAIAIHAAGSLAPSAATNSRHTD